MSVQISTVAIIGVPVPTITRDNLPSVLRGIAGRVYQAWLDHRLPRGQSHMFLHVRVNGEDVEECDICRVNERFVRVDSEEMAEPRIPGVIYDRLLSSRLVPHTVQIVMSMMGPAEDEEDEEDEAVDFPLSDIPYGHNLLTDNTSINNLHTTERVHPDTATYLTTEAAGGRITGIHEHASMLRYLEGANPRSPYTGLSFVAANVRRVAAEAVRLHYSKNLV